MDPKQIQEMWLKFDSLADTARNSEDEQIAAVIEAIKLQTELMNSRLAALEQLLGALLKK